MGEDDGTEDDADVVDVWPEAGDREYLAGVEGTHEQAADEEGELSGQEDSGEVGDELEVLGREVTGGDHSGKSGGEDPGDDDKADDKSRHDAGDGAKDVPGFILLVGVKVFRENGDKRGREGSAGDEEEEQVGNDEGGRVCVGVGVLSEDRVDDDFADDPEDAAEEDADAHDGAGFGYVGGEVGF